MQAFSFCPCLCEANVRPLRPLLVALYATAPLSLYAFGQLQLTPTSVSGAIQDTQGGTIAGARITLVPSSGAKPLEMTSDASGRFGFNGLTAGAYNLRIAANGFETIANSITLAQDAKLYATYTLRIASTNTTVVVTATRSERSITDLPASVSVVTGEQIEQTPARTIDDVLRRVPSVDLPLASTNEQHPTDTIVSMRGLSGIRSLVLLDGIPLNDPFFGFAQWSEIPVGVVERVEVVRGGGSALWGNYAMGGVINTITKPNDRTELVIESAGGSRGSYRTDGHAAFAGIRYGVGIDAGNNHSNGYIEQADGFRGSIDVPNSYTSDTVAVSGDADLASSLIARGRVSHYSNAMNYLTHLQTNGEGTWRYTGALNWKPRDRDALDLNVFHDDERFTTNNTGAPDGADPNQVEYIQNIHRTLVSDTGASLIWTKTYTGVLRSLAVGGDYHGIRGSDAAKIYDENKAYLRTDLGSGNEQFVGAFFQTDLRPLERLQILFSLRYQNFYSYNGLDNTPGGLGSAVPTRTSDNVDPRISVRYQLPKDFALRGAFYSAFRAPTLDNLYRSASVPGYILYSNASLSPETLSGGEFGFDFNKGPVRFQATAYNSHISNLLTYRYLDPSTLPEGFQIRARLINAGSAFSRGFEAELDWRLRSNLSTVVGYTYADSVVTANTEDLASIGVQQPGIPKNRATIGVDWTAYRHIQVSPHLRYLSRTSGDPDNLYHTDPHFIADLAVSTPIRKNLDALSRLKTFSTGRTPAPTMALPHHSMASPLPQSQVSDSSCVDRQDQEVQRTKCYVSTTSSRRSYDKQAG